MASILDTGRWPVAVCKAYRTVHRRVMFIYFFRLGKSTLSKEFMIMSIIKLHGILLQVMALSLLEVRDPDHHAL